MTDAATPSQPCENRQNGAQIEARRKAKTAFETTPILVHSVGKVGSSTVYESLQSRGLAERVFHLHSLRDDGLARYREIQDGLGVPIPEHVYQSEEVLEQMRTKPDHPLKVISLVRDPVAREVSALFENRFLAPHILDAHNAFDPEKTIHHLTERLAYPQTFEQFLTWFDTHIRDVFGIDILATPFSKSRGWQVYRRGSVDLLLIRLEDLSRIGSPVITEFLELPEPVEMDRSRVRHEASYHTVRSGLKLSAAACEAIFHAPLVKHIYTEEQVARMVARWSWPREREADAEQRVRHAARMNLEALREWAERSIDHEIPRRRDRRTAYQRLQETHHVLLAEWEERGRLPDAQPRVAQILSEARGSVSRPGWRRVAGGIRRRLRGERAAA